MFTLKFCSSFEDGTSSQTAICCSHYNVYRFDNRVEITLYKDFTSTDGVTYTVCQSEIEKPHFKVCYIENINGKTIDKI